MDEARIMEWIHEHRIDAARHHIAAWKFGEVWRFCSYEASMFFFGPDNQAVTVNGGLY